MKTITRAVQHEGFIMLEISDDERPPESGASYPYALYPDDPYGAAPALRDELQRLVDAGDITIEEALDEEPSS